MLVVLTKHFCLLGATYALYTARLDKAFWSTRRDVGRVFYAINEPNCQVSSFLLLSDPMSPPPIRGGYDLFKPLTPPHWYIYIGIGCDLFLQFNNQLGGKRKSLSNG